MSRRIAILFLILSLLLSGCSSFLNRQYTSETEHAESYHVKGSSDILTASNYQELINTILMLLETHAEEGIIRIPVTDGTAATMAHDACDEVQQETALGSYLLKYISCTGSLDPRYYELHLTFSYRRSVDQQRAMIHVSSVQALPDLISSAWKKDSKQIAFIFSSAVSPATFTAIAEDMRSSLADDKAWEYNFYPSEAEPMVVEIIFRK